MKRRWLQVVGLAAAGWIVFELIWMATGRPAPQVDYVGRLAELTASHQAPGADGWALLDETAQLAKTTIDDMRTAWREGDAGEGWRPDVSLLLEGPANLDAWRVERDAFDALREAGVVDRLAEIASAPQFVRPMMEADQLYASGWTRLSDIRELSRIRVASMRLAFVDGDDAEVVAGFEQSLAVVRALGHQPLMLDRMLAIWAGGIVLDQLEHALVEHEIDAATGAALLDAFDRQPLLAPEELVFEAQRLGTLEMIQQHYTDDGHGDGRLDMGGSGMPMLGSVGLVGRRETTRLVNAFADGMVANARQTPVARATQPAFDLEAFAEGLDFRHEFIRASMQQVPMILDGSADFAVRAAATRIMVALAAHRAVHGDYPATLDALVPAFLPATPVDPTHGGGFVYRRQPGDAELPFLLYSTGVDTADDTVAVHPDLVATGRTFSESVSIDGHDRLFDPRRPAPEER